MRSQVWEEVSSTSAEGIEDSPLLTPLGYRPSWKSLWVH